MSPTRRRKVRDDASAVPSLIFPDWGTVAPEDSENRVDLPAPLGPSNAVLPGVNSIFTPCNTS